MRTRTRSAALTALPLALALALGGCASETGERKVASAETGDARAKDGGDASSDSGKKGGPGTAEFDDRARDFARCMRENGVPMEDPKDGRIQIGGKGIGRERMEKATRACKEFQPPAMGRAKADPGVAESMRKFARCMRENGVPEFPDPQPDGGIRIDGSMADDPDLQAADRKCKALMPERPKGADHG
jgi:hypothetical protein